MQRRTLSRMIECWVLMAAPAILGGCLFSSCPAKVHQFVASGTAIDGGASTDGGTASGCEALCRDKLGLSMYQQVLSCEPVTSDGGQAGFDCLITVPCEGRRPEALANSGQLDFGDLRGRWFAAMAHLEEASVAAFYQLHDELAEHGASATLLRGIVCAAEDEVRHTRMMRAIARRFGATPVRAIVGSRRSRPLIELAEENAVEGCVRETWGAVFATWQSLATQDKQIAMTLRKIARDETRHAELAWDIARWVDGRLSRAERARLRAARKRAADELQATLTVDPPELLIQCGAPPADVAKRLCSAMRDDLRL